MKILSLIFGKTFLSLKLFVIWNFLISILESIYSFEILKFLSKLSENSFFELKIIFSTPKSGIIFSSNKARFLLFNSTILLLRFPFNVYPCLFFFRFISSEIKLISFNINSTSWISKLSFSILNTKFKSSNL